MEPQLYNKNPIEHLNLKYQVPNIPDSLYRRIWPHNTSKHATRVMSLYIDADQSQKW